MTKQALPYREILLQEAGSTNEYAAALIRKDTVEEFTVVRAIAQTAGKGQKGSSWESEAGKNLTFTLITLPEFLLPEKHFFLSITASLAIVDFLKEYIIDVKIKWPNDIYAAFGKIGGLLIENSMINGRFRESLAGIGLNINQKIFTSDAPNPVSLAMITGKEYPPEECLKRIIQYYRVRYEHLRRKEFASLLDDYYSNLLGYQQSMQYECRGKKFMARIAAIKETGELVLKPETGPLQVYDFKEVTLLLPEKR